MLSSTASARCSMRVTAAPNAQRLLRSAVDPEFLVEVSTDDALGFACSAVEIGDAVVMHGASRRLSERLNAAGYRVFSTDLSEFHRAGGSAKSLTLRLDDGPATCPRAPEPGGGGGSERGKNTRM